LQLAGDGDSGQHVADAGVGEFSYRRRAGHRQDGAFRPVVALGQGVDRDRLHAIGLGALLRRLGPQVGGRSGLLDHADPFVRELASFVARASSKRAASAAVVSTSMVRTS